MAISAHNSPLPLPKLLPNLPLKEVLWTKCHTDIDDIDDICDKSLDSQLQQQQYLSEKIRKMEKLMF